MIELWRILNLFVFIASSSSFNVDTSKDGIGVVRSPSTSSGVSSVTSSSMFGYVINVNNQDTDQSLTVGSPKSGIKNKPRTFHQQNTARGDILSCSLKNIFSGASASCSSINPPNLEDDEFIGINLAGNSSLITCSPNKPFECSSIKYLPGYCYKKSLNNNNWTPLSNQSTSVCPTNTLDMVFLLDGSGSVGVLNFEKVKTWVKTLSSSFFDSKDSTNIGVVQYSFAYKSTPLNQEKYLKTEIELGSIHNREQFNEAVDDITIQGLTTYTAHALNKTIADFKSSPRYNASGNAKVLILLTDGRSTDKEDLPYSANYVRSLGIRTFAVGVGSADKKELQTIATGTDSDERIYYVKDFQDLDEITKELRTAILTYALEGSIGNSSTSNYGLHFAESGFSIQIGQVRYL